MLTSPFFHFSNPSATVCRACDSILSRSEGDSCSARCRRDSWYCFIRSAICRSRLLRLLCSAHHPPAVVNNKAETNSKPVMIIKRTDNTINTLCPVWSVESMGSLHLPPNVLTYQWYLHHFSVAPHAAGCQQKTSFLLYFS